MKDDIIFFSNLIKTRGVSATLLYRGTEHGFSAAHFHSKCDNKGKTISLIQDTNKNVFGGFTSESWISKSGNTKDTTAFIFSVNLKTVYNIVNPNDAIGDYPNY